jgi:hypothetical protein
MDQKETAEPTTNWQLIDGLSDYPIIYRVSTIQGGAGFLPSTVAPLASPLLMSIQQGFNRFDSRRTPKVPVSRHMCHGQVGLN